MNKSAGPYEDGLVRFMMCIVKPSSVNPTLEQVAVVGSDKAFGKWIPQHAMVAEHLGSYFWLIDTRVKANTILDFKIVLYWHRPYEEKHKDLPYYKNVISNREDWTRRVQIGHVKMEVLIEYGVPKADIIVMPPPAKQLARNPRRHNGRRSPSQSKVQGNNTVRKVNGPEHILDYAVDKVDVPKPDTADEYRFGEFDVDTVPHYGEEFDVDSLSHFKYSGNSSLFLQLDNGDEGTDVDAILDDFGVDGTDVDAILDGVGGKGTDVDAILGGVGLDGTDVDAILDCFGVDGTDVDAILDGVGLHGTDVDAILDDIDVDELQDRHGDSEGRSRLLYHERDAHQPSNQVANVVLTKSPHCLNENDVDGLSNPNFDDIGINALSPRHCNRPAPSLLSSNAGAGGDTPSMHTTAAHLEESDLSATIPKFNSLFDMFVNIRENSHVYMSQTKHNGLGIKPENYQAPLVSKAMDVEHGIVEVIGDREQEKGRGRGYGVHGDRGNHEAFCDYRNAELGQQENSMQSCPDSSSYYKALQETESEEHHFTGLIGLGLNVAAVAVDYVFKGK